MFWLEQRHVLLFIIMFLILAATFIVLQDVP